MYISAKSFSTNLPRLQNYITQRKYWENGNKHGEKSQFIKTFSLGNWYFLAEREKTSNVYKIVQSVKQVTQTYLQRMLQSVKR